MPDRLLFRALVGCICVFMSIRCAEAQGRLPACSFQQLDYRADGVPDILVQFNVGTPGNGSVDYELIDATSGSVSHIAVPAAGANQINADLWLPNPLDSSHIYFLTAFGLAGCDPKKPPIANVTIKTTLRPSSPSVPSSPTTGQKPSNIGHSFALSPSKARTDSDLYLSGLLSGASGVKAAYTADIKTQLQYILNQAGESSPQVALVPSFAFTSSTNQKQNGNSVSIGTFLRMGWANQVAPLSFFHLYTVIEPGVAVQADPSFRVVEPLFRVPIYAIPKPILYGPLVMYLQPMFGIEAGGSTKMPSPSDYSVVPAALPSTAGIFRPFAGGSLYININKKSPKSAGTKTIFSFETDYVNRWPIIREPFFSQSSTGKLTLLGVGTQPRGYLTNKIERDVGSYFSIALEDDHGKLPPLYTNVDNKYSISLTYKASLKAGAGVK